MIFDILFLGTSAHDFDKRLQGELQYTLDKDARRSSGLLINGRILIDCGTHTLNSLEILQIPLTDITDIFITHLHSDHFDVENIQRLANGHKLRLWVREDALLPPLKNVKIVRMRLEQTYQAPYDIRITGLEANHEGYAQAFVLERQGKRLLYATDGAWVTNRTYAYLKNLSFDFIALDCTVGDYEGDWRVAEHNSIPMVRLLLQSYKTVGMVTEKTQVYLTHLAPSLHKSHAETEGICATFSAKVAYDGLKIQI